MRIIPLLILSLILFIDTCYASDGAKTLGDIFSSFQREGLKEEYKSFILGFTQLCSFGFLIATVFKFKQYKDNPTQIPVSTPFALLMVTILSFTSIYIVKPIENTLNISTDSSCDGLPGSGNCD